MENAIWNGKCLVACEVAEDYEVEKEIRKASYSGELRCPDADCCSPILRYCHGEIREPYFAHRDNAECDYVLFEKGAGVFHGLRVLLYEHFKTCDYPVQMETKVLPHHYSHLYFEWEDGTKTAIEIGTKTTNINDVEKLQEEYAKAAVQVVWLVADQPGKVIEEEQEAFAIYKAEVEEATESLQRQYETLRSHREIEDTRMRVREVTGKDYESRKESILQYMDQQERPVLDAWGERWIRCEFCGEVKEVAEFVSFGGRGRVNLGRCQECREV